ncbi:MAG: hypothetical protein WD738_17565 [Pirellulales bacterium]
MFAADSLSPVALSVHELVGQDSNTRLDLRLHGRTEDGKRCVADVSIYANSADSLKHEAHEAPKTLPGIPTMKRQLGYVIIQQSSSNAWNC